MSIKNKEYYSFLLSLKQVQTNDLQTWIVALRNVHTGNQQIFSNVDGLIRFLQTEFGRDEEQMDTALQNKTKNQSSSGNAPAEF
jgi:hypothetical protein